MQSGTALVFSVLSSIYIIACYFCFVPTVIYFLNCWLDFYDIAGTVNRGNTFSMKFSSDNNINGTGFYAVYSVYDVLSTPSSLLNDPAGQGWFIVSFVAIF